MVDDAPHRALAATLLFYFFFAQETLAGLKADLAATEAGKTEAEAGIAVFQDAIDTERTALQAQADDLAAKVAAETETSAILAQVWGALPLFVCARVCACVCGVSPRFSRHSCHPPPLLCPVYN